MFLKNVFGAKQKPYFINHPKKVNLYRLRYHKKKPFNY